MPGAFIIQYHEVVDALGDTPSNKIRWSGPGEWITSREGVPAGYSALWLGTRDTTRPHIVYVKDKPTRESDLYDRAYRRGWKAKRRPTVPEGYTEYEVNGLQQGWRDSPNNKKPGSWL